MSTDTAATDITYTEDTEAGRIDLLVAGEVAGWVDYRPAGESVILAHTEVVAGHEGQGLGGLLVREAMRRFADRGLLVMPTCPFALGWLRTHPELHELVDPSMRAQVAG